MKSINKFIYLGLVCLLGLFTSCDEDVTIEVLDSNVTGALVTYNQTSYNYVVGTASDAYSFPFVVRQDSKNQVSEVIVYKSFFTYDTADVWLQSNEVEEERFTIGANFREEGSFSKIYTDLTNGLTIPAGQVHPGGALPESDGGLIIGDYWQFRFVSVMSDGAQYEVAQKVKLTVSTRFAGVYTCIDAEYHHPTLGLFYTERDWNSANPSGYVVSSVDAITYRIENYFGLFARNDDGILFQIDPVTLAITYLPDQVGNGQPMTYCPDNANLGLVPCGSSNFAVAAEDPADDQLSMVFGYLTPGSGPRQFYQVLQRK